MPTFGLSLLIIGGIPAIVLWLRRHTIPAPLPMLPATHRLPRWALVLVWILGIWTVLKIAAASVTFLLLTPTYLDDTLDNWNLRAKVFYVDKALTLVMPNEDPIASPLGVSSYPPSVPMTKAWFAFLNGEWNDPLVNAIHAAWLLIALVLVYGCVRRLSSRWTALLAVYGLASLPLYLMHGTNTYADCFLSAHVFAAAGLLLHAWLTPDPKRMRAFLRLAAIAMAVLPFTKNEAMLIYLPVLLLTALGIILVRRREGTVASGAFILGTLAVVAVPWLAFKWLNGLTFGNAKAFTSFQIAWHPEAAFAVMVNTLFEANWLLLFPLLLVLLIWKFRAAFRDYLPLTAFFLTVYLGQMMLYFFTSLSVEATMQTGYARGVIHLSPVATVLAVLLLEQTMGTWKAWSRQVQSMGQ
jgi:4-amino-4-deoxy-L-arabinose transferase-like glycosyltransferase